MATNLTLEMKLFVQLALDEHSFAEVKVCLEDLNKFGVERLVGEGALHVTVIHIGKLQKLYTAVSTVVGITEERFLQLAKELQFSLEGLLAESPSEYILTPKHFTHLGKNKATYVLILEPSENLKELHQKSLMILKSFLTNCGIKDDDKFMRNDLNLQYALKLLPHLTLAKSPVSHELKVPETPIGLVQMPVLYEK